MLLIAGPCSAESKAQVLRVAGEVADAGATIFRAGVWKPRTKPGGFEGVGSEALQWLAEAKEATGLRPATEIANARHLSEAIAAGIDCLWLGARTSTDPFAVQEIADAISSLPEHKRKKLTVMVKNPVNPDLELWVGAIERIQLAGIRDIVAIHRGFSSYGPHLYRNEPMWAIPFELKRRLPSLPIVCDPSHIAGQADIVASVARHAVNMGFDGLMVEVHSDPSRALSDASQQLTPAAFRELLQSLPAGVRKEGSSQPDLRLQQADLSLEDFRARIDLIDEQLISLLAERMKISEEIGQYKHREGMPVVQPERYRRLMEKHAEDAASLGLSPSFARRLLSLIHEESVRRQL